MQNWQPGRRRNGCSALELFISLFSFPLRNNSSLTLCPHFAACYKSPHLQPIRGDIRIPGCGGYAAGTTLHKQSFALLLHYQLSVTAPPWNDFCEVQYSVSLRCFLILTDLIVVFHLPNYLCLVCFNARFQKVCLINLKLYADDI